MSRQHPHRNTHLSRHHILSRSRKGKSLPSNTLMLWRDRHDAFHHIFGNLTLDEIKFDIIGFYRHYQWTHSWEILFHNLTLQEVVRLLERTSKIKHSLKKRWH